VIVLSALKVMSRGSITSLKNSVRAWIDYYYFLLSFYYFQSMEYVRLSLFVLGLILVFSFTFQKFQDTNWSTEYIDYFELQCSLIVNNASRAQESCLEIFAKQQQSDNELAYWPFLFGDCFVVNKIIMSGRDSGYFGLSIIGMS
jgi:hypothetical protein